MVKFLQFTEVSAGNAVDYVAQKFIDTVNSNDRPTITCATGKTFHPVYERIVDLRDQIDARKLHNTRIVMLDEYEGVGADEVGGFQRELKDRLLDPLDLGADNLIAIEGFSPDATINFRRQLQEIGPRDLTLLGIGTTGHIGFIPCGEVVMSTGMVNLDSASLVSRHANIAEKGINTGFTQGYSEIFDESKQVVLLALGATKIPAVKRFSNDDHGFDPGIPSSYGFQHKDYSVVTDFALLRDL